MFDKLDEVEDSYLDIAIQDHSRNLHTPSKSVDLVLLNKPTIQYETSSKSQPWASDLQGQAGR